MKNIGPKWRNLADGLLRVETFEAKFRAEWGPRLEKARRDRQEAERQRNRRLGRAAVIAALALTLLLLAAALVLHSSSTGTTVILLAIMVPAILVLGGLGLLFRTPDPLPDPSDLSGQWWDKVSGRTSSVRRSGPALSARHYGDVGEEAFALVIYLRSTWQ